VQKSATFARHRARAAPEFSKHCEGGWCKIRRITFIVGGLSFILGRRLLVDDLPFPRDFLSSCQFARTLRGLQFENRAERAAFGKTNGRLSGNRTRRAAARSKPLQ
jgi:hypothetical protein